MISQSLNLNESYYIKLTMQQFTYKFGVVMDTLDQYSDNRESCNMAVTMALAVLFAMQTGLLLVPFLVPYFAEQ